MNRQRANGPDSQGIGCNKHDQCGDSEPYQKRPVEKRDLDRSQAEIAHMQQNHSSKDRIPDWAGAALPEPPLVASRIRKLYQPVHGHCGS